MKRTLLILATVLTLAAQRGGADAALGAAIHMEEAEGNYKGAIEAYKKFVSKYATNRALAAKAELRLGLCYEKLGDAEAKKAFERVVARYADQKEVVAQAQARLNKLAPNLSGSLSAVRLIEGNVYPTGTVSRDGQWIPWGDSEHGDLMLRNLNTGESRFLTRERSKWAQFVVRAVLSSDGKRIAYSMFRDRRNHSVELVNADGTGHKMLIPASAGLGAIILCGWLQDGKSILVLGPDAKIGQIDTASGALTWRETLSNGGARMGTLSPDGRNLVYVVPLPGPQPAAQLYIYDLAARTSRQVAKEHLISAGPAWSADSQSVYFTSTLRGVNGIYATPLDGEPKLIHTGAESPRAYGSSEDGTLIVSDNSISSDLLTVPFDSSAAKITGVPAKIKTEVSGRNVRPSWSPDGKTLAYFRYRGTQVATVVLQDAATGREREFVPPSNMAQMSWHPNSRTLLLDASPGFGPRVPPAIRLLDVTAGEFKELDREFEQGPLLPSNSRYSHDGSEIIFRSRKGDEYAIMARNIATKQTRTIIPHSPVLSFATDGLSPDGKLVLVDWRKPEGNFKSLALVPIEGGEPRIILEGQGYFLGHAQFTPDGRYVIAHGTFGFLGDTKPGLWRISLTGEKPEKLMDHNSIGGAPSIHPNGREIVYADGERVASLWAIKYKR